MCIFNSLVLPSSKACVNIPPAHSAPVLILCCAIQFMLPPHSSHQNVISEFCVKSYPAQFTNQSVNVLLRWSTLLTTFLTFMYSTNLEMMPYITQSRTVICIKTTSGPNTYSWGTLLLTLLQSEKQTLSIFYLILYSRILSACFLVLPMSAYIIYFQQFERRYEVQNIPSISVLHPSGGAWSARLCYSPTNPFNTCSKKIGSFECCFAVIRCHFVSVWTLFHSVWSIYRSFLKCADWLPVSVLRQLSIVRLAHLPKVSYPSETLW